MTSSIETPLRPELLELVPHPWTIFSEPVSELEASRVGRALLLYPAGYSHTKWWDRFHHDNPFDSFPNLVNFTIHSFKIKEVFNDKAQEVLKNIGQEFLSKRHKKSKKGKKENLKEKRGKEKTKTSGKKEMRTSELVYVGIHNRRTDHLQYQQEVGFTSLEPSYFLQGSNLHFFLIENMEL